jgi:hypothetical protein
MHHLVAQFDVGPAAMTAAPSAIAGRGAPRGRSSDLPQVAHMSAVSERAALGFAPRGGAAGFASYVTAACIAAGLVVAWLGLCVI